MKKINKVTILTTIICLIPVIVGIVLYPQLPDQIVTHWDSNGEPNGYSSKFVGAVLFPIILLAVNIFTPALMKMDPKYDNMSEKLIQVVYWVIPVISVIGSGVTISAALGRNLRIELILPMLFGVLFVFLGNYLPKTKQSYTMGIKLPWTLHSEENWNATHRMAGYLWVAGGILMIIGSLFPFRFIIFTVVVAIMILIPVIYSYLFYRKETNKE